MRGCIVTRESAMGEKVIILKGRSLFTDGVVSKLTHSSLMSQFEVIDMCQPDPLQAILEAKPGVLVVDENDPEYSEKLEGRLFKIIPNVKIILLDSETTHVRVVQWAEHNIPQLSDLLDEINAASEPVTSKVPKPAVKGGELPANAQLNV